MAILPKSSLFALLLCISAFAGAEEIKCPHEEEDLIKWTDKDAWDNGEVPAENTDVFVTKPVLLNKNALELGNLTIAKTGKLVFSPDVDISLKVQFILIYGEMHIGSESCPYTGKATITLKGERGLYDVKSFNEKFIGVPGGGTLELHGENRLSWTKLNKTLPKLTKDNGIIFQHEDNVNLDQRTNGIQLYIFNPVTGEMENYAYYRLVFQGQKKLDIVLEELVEYLNGIEVGKVVAMAVQRNIARLDISKFFTAVEELIYGEETGYSQLRSVKKNSAWAMVTLAGDSDSTQEAVSHEIEQGNTPNVAEVELVLPNQKRKFQVTSRPNTKGIKVDFRVTNTDFSMPVLDVIDDVSTWKAGDKLLIASTDYDYRQTEFAEVISCSGNQVRVNFEPKYTHFGEVYKNVDMRAEVALMSRNIKIQGETTEEKQFGGHIKALKGFKNVHIEGVELTMMGQQTDLGRYPIHFHFCEEVGNMENPPYIKSNSIHHTFARCTTVHATHGLQVINNVCWQTLGHGYFLEDGGEKDTVFDGNLGGGQLIGGLIPVDEKPTTFWITNPKTYVRNNAAIGGQGKGYWFVYPDIPVGPSSDKGYMKPMEARHTAIYQFYNNVAHSYIRNGLFIDNILHPNNTASEYNQYEPYNDPMDETSGAKEVLIERYTGYKNVGNNAWVRGGLFRLKHISLSDSRIGMFFLRENKQEAYFEESVIIGDSVNIGEPAPKFNQFNRSLPVPWKPYFPREGFKFKTGPVFLSTTWFDGFISNDVYKAGALTFDNVDTGHAAPDHTAEALQFGFDDGPNTGNRVCNVDDILSDIGRGSDDIATFRDVDGSTTSIPESQVVPTHPFYTTDLCRNRSNWEMAYCPYYYGQIRAIFGSKAYMARDDDPTRIDISLAEKEKEVIRSFLVILGGSHSYIMGSSGTLAKKIVVRGFGLTRDDSVRIGVCIPRNATFLIKGKYAPGSSGGNWNKKWTKADSVEDIDEDSTGVKYLYDQDVGVIFFKLLDNTNRGVGDHNSCTEDTCPTVIIEISDGDLDDGDCIERAYPKYKRSPDVEQVRRRFGRSVSLSATSPDPPATWGAGPTR